MSSRLQVDPQSFVFDAAIPEGTTTSRPLRAAVYCQTLWKSPDLITVQRVTVIEALKLTCDPEPEIRVYADDGRCTSTQVREQLQTMLSHVEAGLIDCIAVMGHERLSDTEKDYQVLKLYLEKRGIPLIICEQAPARLVRAA